MASDKKIIGWREKITLPDLDLGKIKVKVDTGARTSALHATNIKVIKRGTKKWVQFRAHFDHNDSDRYKTVKAPLIEKRTVKSSIGFETRRPVVLTPIKISGEDFDIELTLVDRSPMGFRMLLGRQAIRGKFLVDTSKSYVGTAKSKGKLTSKRKN